MQSESERKQRRKEAQTKYYQANKERLREYDHQRRYGIPYQVRLDMLKEQDYKCAICECEISTSAHVDHDHMTDYVRGLLCFNCNIMLGMSRDNILLLEKAAAYLRSMYVIAEQ